MPGATGRGAVVLQRGETSFRAAQVGIKLGNTLLQGKYFLTSNQHRCFEREIFAEILGEMRRRLFLPIDEAVRALHDAVRGDVAYQPRQIFFGIPAEVAKDER